MRCVSGFNYAEIKRAAVPLLTGRMAMKWGFLVVFHLDFKGSHLIIRA